MLNINGPRLWADLESLARIGATAAGGVTRLALSAEDEAGRRWFRRRALEAGLEVCLDGAGNLSARLPAVDPHAPTLVLGSHLDTVPAGGRFDGALGVLAALEVLRVVKDRQLALAVHLEAMSFTDEEGTHLGELGSLAFAGRLTEEDLGRARGGRGALEEGLSRLGLSAGSALSAGRRRGSVLGFLELHIEQGTRLEEAGLEIGAVTGIVGIRSGHLQFRGRVGHAGTLPMERRADALWGAAEFVGRARRRVMEEFFPGVMNCGDVAVSPGAFNVVPGLATLALELRHGSEEELRLLHSRVLRVAAEVAREFGLTVEYEAAGGCPASPCDERFVAAVEDGAEALGLSCTRLLSFAGHDAQAVAALAPTAMIFVPCRDGVSHHPAEWCEPRDVENGANVLLHAALTLAAPRWA